MTINKYYVIKKLNFVPVFETVSGSLWERESYPQKGSKNKLIGCRYEGQAAEDIKDLKPGDKIQILDSEVKYLTDRGGNEWECLIIRSFKKISINVEADVLEKGGGQRAQ